MVGRFSTEHLAFRSPVRAMLSICETSESADRVPCSDLGERGTRMGLVNMAALRLAMPPQAEAPHCEAFGGWHCMIVIVSCRFRRTTAETPRIASGLLCPRSLDTT